MSAESECAVCCLEFTNNPLVRVTRRTARPCICKKCTFIACTLCQTKYAKGDCMNCHFEFPRSFIVETLGMHFYKNIVVPAIIKDMMMEQQVNLETVDVQSTVEWLNACAEIRKNSRFGQVQQFPPKPEPTGHVFSAKYLCPFEDCRGLVLGDVCNSCNHHYCIQCHEEKKDVHVCNEDAKMVIRDSKPCPHCYSLIHRTEGCSAMRCTSCGTGFDWITMQKKHENIHHNGGDVVYGLDALQQEQVKREVGNDYCQFSNLFNRVPRDAIDRYMETSRTEFGDHFVEPPLILLDILYQVTAAVRKFKVQMFKEQTMITELGRRMHDLRVQYLMHTINKHIWEQRVYTYQVRYKSYMLYANVVNIYLSITDGLQSELRESIIHNAASNAENTDGGTSIYTSQLEQLKQLTTLCNQSFAELHKDYPIDSSPLYIRNLDDGSGVDDCGFYTTENTLFLGSASLNNPDAKQIVLYEYQKEHTSKLYKILQNSHFALDLSMLGSGKTFVAMMLFQMRQYSRGLIIAPASVVGKWKELLFEYGLSGVEVYSFNSISGKIGKHNRVGHLIRRCDTLDIRGQNIIKHHINTRLHQYIRDGIFVIFDEIQNIKNKQSAQTNACKEIINAIHQEYLTNNRNSNSRALLISGSPIDTYEHAEQLFKNIGIITDKVKKDLIVLGPDSDLDLVDLAEVREFCNPFNPDTCLAIQNKYKKGSEECYQYFVQIVKPYLSESMVVFGNTHTVRKFNGMFDISPQCKELLKRGIKKIRLMTLQRNNDDGREDDRGIFFAAMQKALLMIETAQIPLMIQLTREKMAENPTCKIVLACNYTQTIRDLVRELEPEFGTPLILNGGVPQYQRQTVLSLFQEPNTNHRILIGNTHVISTGIDLDDKDGGYPRICFVSPNYNVIDLYQLSYRFLRALDTKSDSEIYMLYSKECPVNCLMSNLKQKGNIMKTITAEQSKKAKVIFPCDFADYEQPDQTADWHTDCDAIFNRMTNA